jgi:peptide/nickel transport system substrate-binding protein
MKLKRITALCLVGLIFVLGTGFKTKTNELVFATTADVVGMSPILTNDTQSSAITDQVYETLFTRKGDNFGEVVPLLAESYETPDDNTWVIKLKKGIKFHDGTPFNAQAVVFTFQRIVDPKTAAPRASILKAMESVEAKDDYTVVLKTKKPYGAMLACLAHTNTSIVSPAAVEKYGSVMNNPVGTGPFVFDSRVPGDNVVLKANPDYWQGKPKLDKFVMKVVPEISSIIAMLETGEVDFMVDIPPEQLARLKANPDVISVLKQGTRINYLGFNHEVKELKDIKVRQAIAHAVDRDAFCGDLEWYRLPLQRNHRTPGLWLHQGCGSRRLCL